MAKPKKKPSKPAKKTKPKATKPPAKRRARKAAAPALSPDQVRALPKPPPDYLDIIDTFIEIAPQFPKHVRSGDTTLAQLKRKASTSDRDWKKEQALDVKQQAAMRPLRDRRLRSEADTWSTFLNFWDITKANFDDHPEIAAAMETVREMLTNPPKPKKPTTT